MLHFILTRFNLPLWTDDKHFVSSRTDEWLELRYNLFEKYCLPSVANQTTTNFVWFVLFDEFTPQEHISRLRTYKEICPQFEPRMVKRKYSWDFAYIFGKLIDEYINKHIDKPSADCRFVTTWLDNDDAVHRDYFNTIQQKAETSNHLDLLYFVHGAQYLTNMNMAMEYMYPYNHFVSLVENYDSQHLPYTAFANGSHMFIKDIPEITPVHITEDRRLWMEVVHDHNVVNDITYNNFKPITNKHFLDDYNINESYTTNVTRTYITQYIPSIIKLILHKIICKIGLRKKHLI
ncbi:MAG: putative rhamnosyl transferase [Bacteroidales bacterium]|nr:putative rhamnosyl transferase [Bacteroidales bacterium]